MKRLILISLLLAGCATAPVKQETPVSPSAGEKGWSYDSDVVPMLTQKMLSADPGEYCPKYKSIDKVNFWQAFEKAVSRAECGWDANQDYGEDFDADNGGQQISSGLFQLSLDDVKKGTPNCKLLSKTTIHSPLVNLRCAMEIQDWLIGSRATFRQSLGRYWSTVRENHNANDSDKKRNISVTLTETIRWYMPQCFQ